MLYTQIKLSVIVDNGSLILCSGFTPNSVKFFTAALEVKMSSTLSTFCGVAVDVICSEVKE